MIRYKILEKKMTFDEVQDVLSKHKRWSLPITAEVFNKYPNENKFFWVGTESKNKNIPTYNPAKRLALNSNRLFKNNVIIKIDEPTWLYKIRTWLGL